MLASLRIHGLNTAVDLTFPEDTPAVFLDAVARAWSRCLDPGRDGAHQSEPVIVQPPHDDSPDARDAALQSLTQHVTHSVIVAQSGNLLMFHAGAVSHPDSGRSLVFVAPGGTGKTTLAMSLGQDYGYHTDETVGMDANGLIQPYQKPLSLRRSATWIKREASPDELALQPAHPAPTLARIALLRRSPGFSGGPEIEELGALAAVSALLAGTSELDRFPAPLEALAGIIARTGPVLCLTYSDLPSIRALAGELIGVVR
ncbi:MAG: hypothetical protein EOL91_05350 [Actinobacteria bacterium]|nr:hypothetical protein [Actinomycetota bacterium]